VERADIELAFIRTLSIHGLNLGSLAPQVRRERVRVSIITQGLQDQSFDGQQTYEQAFWLCYGSPVELRGEKWPAHKPVDDSDEEGEDDEDLAPLE
jgi:hypothetical protein